jgi:hypothetical protein
MDFNDLEINASFYACGEYIRMEFAEKVGVCITKFKDYN